MCRFCAENLFCEMCLANFKVSKTETYHLFLEASLDLQVELAKRT